MHIGRIGYNSSTIKSSRRTRVKSLVPACHAAMPDHVPCQRRAWLALSEEAAFSKTLWSFRKHFESYLEDRAQLYSAIVWFTPQSHWSRFHFFFVVVWGVCKRKQNLLNDFLIFSWLLKYFFATAYYISLFVDEGD